MAFVTVACHSETAKDRFTGQSDRPVSPDSAEVCMHEAGQQQDAGASLRDADDTQTGDNTSHSDSDENQNNNRAQHAEAPQQDEFQQDELQKKKLQRNMPNLPRVSLEALPSRVQEVPHLSSFMLYHDGEILAEHFNGTMNRNRALNIKSASKSILSALVGIAVREGFIESLDDPIAQYLPGYFETLENQQKRQITIRHLLTMSSGLESTSFRNYSAWVTSSDWVGYALHQELEREPGTHMDYSTGDTHLLSAVLTEAAGMSTRRFAERYLFGPMGIRPGGWDRDPAGYYFGGNNMSLSPNDLLDFGKLYLMNGVYEGRRLIPSEWVDATFTGYFQDASYNYRDHDYGYLWWRNIFAGHDVWFAWGYGGQYLFVIPELKAVAVFTGDPLSRAAGRNNRIYEVVEEVIIPGLFHIRPSGAWPVEKFSKRVAT